MSQFCFIPTLVAVLLFTNELHAANDIEQLPVRGEWERTADAPLSNREGASIAWSGSEIYVFGGTEILCPTNSTPLCRAPSSPPLANGAAAYNPLTDEWRLITPPPVGVIGGQTATIGNDIFSLALGSFAPRSIHLLRYRSDLDIWDEFNLPENVDSGWIIAFGTDIVFYNSTDEAGPASDWLLDTMTGTWTKLPDDPLGPSFNRQYVAHDNTLYLFGHALVPSPGGADGPSYLLAAKFQGQQWIELPAADSIGSAPTLVSGDQLISPELGCADGGRINNYGRCIAYGAVFDTATETWHELPNAPGRGTNYSFSSGGISASGLVLFQSGYPALDAVTNEWFIVPSIGIGLDRDQRIQSAGPYGFVFGGTTSGIDSPSRPLNDSQIWKPQLSWHTPQ